MDLAFSHLVGAQRKNLSAAHGGGAEEEKPNDDAALKPDRENQRVKERERTTHKKKTLTLRQDGHRSVSGKKRGWERRVKYCCLSDDRAPGFSCVCVSFLHCGFASLLQRNKVIAGCV